MDWEIEDRILCSCHRVARVARTQAHMYEHYRSSWIDVRSNAENETVTCVKHATWEWRMHAFVQP